MKDVFENLEAEVDQNEIDLLSGEIEQKNLLITNENLIAECLSKDVFYTATDSVLNVSRFSDMHNAFTIAQKRITDLESKNFNLRNKIQNDDQDSMIKYFSKLEVEHFNLQLKFRGNMIHELKEKISHLREKNSDADPTLNLKALVSQNKDLTAKVNALHDLNERFKAKNEKVKQYYKEFKPKVLAPGSYPIDIEPIPPRLKKNQEVHLHYIKHLKKNVETLREIVEEDKKASTNSLRKKQVTFVKPYENLTHNTPPQVEHQKINSTNALGIPSTGVKGASAANRNTPPKVLPTKQWKPTGRLLPLGRQCPLVRSTTLKSDYMPAEPHETIASIVLWTVRFGNDHFGAIIGYGDYVIGDSVISKVYYVEGLGLNLFSVGQFCDSDLEVTFRKHTCFVRDLDGVDLIKGSHGTNLYTISIEDIMRSSPICLLSKASKNKSWLCHRRLNHLNFGTLNDLARKDLVIGLPRLKFEKDHLSFACQLGKSRKATHKPKTINSITEVLHTLYIDLCIPLRVQSINGKKYILNGVVKRRNCTLVEAARTILIFSKAPLFLWAEVVATACYS
ncbi:retrovirus-related pol polyprotein from transposon TNT 1-94 [Tanacetum coccineum]